MGWSWDDHGILLDFHGIVPYNAYRSRDEATWNWDASTGNTILHHFSGLILHCDDPHPGLDVNEEPVLAATKESASRQHHLGGWLCRIMPPGNLQLHIRWHSKTWAWYIYIYICIYIYIYTDWWACFHIFWWNQMRATGWNKDWLAVALSPDSFRWLSPVFWGMVHLEGQGLREMGCYPSETFLPKIDLGMI